VRKLPLLVAWLAFLSAPAYSQCGEVDESALRWLDRMSHSLRETSYRGVFTYQAGTVVQTMRITHSVNGLVESEQVTRLTGHGARVVRMEHPLDCVHPGHRLVRLGKLYTSRGGECGVAAHYDLKMAGSGRIAGREAVMVNVLPRDMYRYGYQLALDSQTGLLLKTQTVAEDGRVLEQFQFADVHIGEVEMDGTHVDLVHQAAHSGDGHDSHDPASSGRGWSVSWLPGGFMPTENNSPLAADKTYTDGLAVFTVFLESAPDLPAPGEGRARQGGTTAYTRGLAIAGNPVLVTVLGEIPVNTARMVADSIRWEPSDVN